MNTSNNRFHTVRVVPTCHTSEVDDGEILFAPTEIPNACPKNGTAMLRQIACHIQDDNNADIELVFFSNSATTEALGATAVNFLGGYNGGGNATDTEVENACPLGNLTLDFASGIAPTDVSSTSSEYDESRNYTDNILLFKRNVNMPVFPGNLTSVGASESSSIYFYGIATATKTYTASGLVFYFTFEY